VALQLKHPAEQRAPADFPDNKFGWDGLNTVALVKFWWGNNKNNIKYAKTQQ